MSPFFDKPFVAIACGGTGGHLFPGLAIAEQLRAKGCEVMALISPKDVDQESVRQVTGISVKTLPAVRESIEQKDWKLAEEQIARVGKVLENTGEAIQGATAELTRAIR